MTDQSTQPIGVIPPERVKEILAELHAADPVRYPITPPKPSLAERVEARIRAEWPGTHQTPLRGEVYIPAIREGGATDTLVKLVASIIEQEERPWPSR